MDCPCCGAPLFETEMGEARFAACEACGGALIPNNKLVPLMEALAGSAFEALDLEAYIEPAPPMDPPPSCPGCRRRMTPFGYLGSPMAPLYRCDEHGVVFGDERALGTAVLLYARTNSVLLARQAQNDEMRESWARTTRARAAGRSKARAQMMGMALGGIRGGAAIGALHDVMTKK